MPLGPLERLNVKQVLTEYSKDRQVLERYDRRGFNSLKEALTYITEQEKALKKELKGEE